jgi:hypothetical protein
VTSTPGGIGWVNALVVWLLPQQLGIAWKRGRFGGLRPGAVVLVLGLAWLGGRRRVGYPVAMVGGDLDGSSNVLPPTLALVGVMWVQVGAVLLFEGPARRALSTGRSAGRRVLGALGMPLYLWHKLAELPAAWLGERLGAPIDAGVPGEAGFWLGPPVVDRAVSRDGDAGDGGRHRLRDPPDAEGAADDLGGGHLRSGARRCSAASSPRWRSVRSRARPSG